MGQRAVRHVLILRPEGPFAATVRDRRSDRRSDRHSMANSDSNAPAVGTTPNLDTEVGRLVVENGLATRTEIDFCREQQKQASDPNQRSLTDLLVEHQFITANQAKRIRKNVEERKSSQIPGYQLIGKLGKGAMATVYKARQMALDR